MAKTCRVVTLRPQTPWYSVFPIHCDSVLIAPGGVEMGTSTGMDVDPTFFQRACVFRGDAICQ
jgi:hypothetical protein